MELHVCMLDQRQKELSPFIATAAYLRSSLALLSSYLLPGSGSFEVFSRRNQSSDGTLLKFTGKFLVRPMDPKKTGHFF